MGDGVGVTGGGGEITLQLSAYELQSSLHLRGEDWHLASTTPSAKKAQYAYGRHTSRQKAGMRSQSTSGSGNGTGDGSGDGNGSGKGEGEGKDDGEGEGKEEPQRAHAISPTS